MDHQRTCRLAPGIRPRVANLADQTRGSRSWLRVSLLTLLLLTSCRSGRMAADPIRSDFSVDPRQEGWGLSDWSLSALAAGGWSADGYLSLPPGFTPFWVSPQFAVSPLDFYRITVRSRGTVGVCGVGYNQAATWGRYPSTNWQGLLVADDWTVIPSPTDWQTNQYCSRALINATTCGVRLCGGDVDDVSVALASRAEVRAWADTTYAAMPPLNYVPARDRFLALSRTRQRLQQRQEVTVVFLGDSIMNDTCNSTFDVLLERAYAYSEGTRVRAIPAVGGGTGMDKWADDANWNWPQADLDLQQAVIDQRPDLVLLGGISNGTNYGAFGIVIDRILTGINAQFGYTPDMLLLTGAFGTGADPAGYADQLRTLAGQRAIGFMDMRAVWLDYVIAAEGRGIPRTHFYRDATHANHFGKQMLGRALVAELAPDPPRMLAIRQSSGAVQVTWASEPGVRYSLWTQSRLDDANLTLVTAVIATGSEMSATVNAGGGQAFYRVSTP
jgi:hypothetical protein